MLLSHEIILCDLTTQSQQEAPTKLLFFDPIAEGLYAEAIVHDESEYELEFVGVDQNRIIIHQDQGRTPSTNYAVYADGRIVELVSPEANTWNYGVE
jgi:hypothetical protein